MDIYRLMKYARRVKSPRLKMLGLWLMHVCRRRYLGLFFDPVLACNLQCRMCYFSDPERRKTLHGVMPIERVRQLADGLFHRALKLQIGCGAEPTLYKNLEEVVRLAKQKQVPYVSITTNGNLLTTEKLETLIAAGLDEMTLSVHGLKPTTYETLMQGAKFGRFLSLLESIKAVKQEHPAFKVRINYTMNTDNVDDLALFPEVFRDVPIDVLQLRPVQKIGNSAYTDFSTDHILDVYNSIIAPLVMHCKALGITCLVPSKDAVSALPDDTPPLEKAVYDMTYCNIEPTGWNENYDLDHDTFETYSRRTHRARRMLKMVFCGAEKDNGGKGKTKKMIYDVK